VELAPDLVLDEKRLARNFLTTSSCGLCGKASLETLPAVGRIRLPDGFVVSPSSVHQLPDRLRDAQTVFDPPAACTRPRSSTAVGGCSTSRRTSGATTRSTS
jgi:formate dehydrogenase assembly factor FdhD